ncbi:hypothetical protein K6Q96_08910 [Grimontia kaedaensis]|uniref:DUF1353 domain-containing protein n=1 Tax=Grimontia kaedaensis TaxID=2872157 RepID=A0ABY4WPT1_9GAMM|nr:hypothetical protein [Grimontia kaedaensis]USH01060.1 hypothetical protein K6Q96_08910 [Grimontia kaedaensis]
MHVWRFRLSAPFYYQHAIFDGVVFDNEWAKIEHGQITVKTGYAWDGCSPKWHLFGLGTIGTPDGTLRFSKPWTWEASLVHDILCQFRAALPFTQKEVTQVFRDQLVEAKWPLTGLYVWAVDNLGPQDFPQ